MGLCWILFIDQLASRDLWASHEARAAQNAQRMIDEGQLLVPRQFNDDYDLQKPPLFYWSVAVLGRIRGGVDPVAVRLPSVASALACVLLVYVWLVQAGRPIAGMVGATALTCAQHFTWMAQVGRIDSFLTLTTAVAILALRGASWRRGLVAVLALSMGILLKGPVGFVLPLAVVVALAWFERRLGDTVRMLVWVAPSAVALVVPWFFAANRETHGEFVRVFFWHHNVDRAMGGSDSLAIHPWWYYGPRLIVDVFPASLLFPIAGWHFLRGYRGIDAGARLGLFWFGLVVCILSLSRFKRADYLLPAYPGMAIFLGCVIEAWLQSVTERTRRWAFRAMAWAVVATASIWFVMHHWVMPRSEPFRECRTFAARIREMEPRPRLVLFFRVEAHALTFHLGRRVNTFLEWENLDVWAGRPGSYLVVMTPDCAQEWHAHVTAGRLELVDRNDVGGGPPHERPLVLMRTRPHRESVHVPPEQQTGHVVGGHQCGATDSEPSADPGKNDSGVVQRALQTRPALRADRR
jgi:4-amino-4-deoxy-L-arabinose transferase-like glycosyltransferase